MKISDADNEMSKGNQKSGKENENPNVMSIA
jgi:hypothetical protein